MSKDEDVRKLHEELFSIIDQYRYLQWEFSRDLLAKYWHVLSRRMRELPSFQLSAQLKRSEEIASE